MAIEIPAALQAYLPADALTNPLYLGVFGVSLVAVIVLPCLLLSRGKSGPSKKTLKKKEKKKSASEGTAPKSPAKAESKAAAPAPVAKGEEPILIKKQKKVAASEDEKKAAAEEKARRKKASEEAIARNLENMNKKGGVQQAGKSKMEAHQQKVKEQTELEKQQEMFNRAQQKLKKKDADAVELKVGGRFAAFDD
eukprot:gnl/TRDRNA2_/TRDRNA2_188280_c0_seq1.p1 gnl/TRDRNA2_/TRDRNA2_188280_c0~~gnl/TRDRNA2_/TRDRNA2_188280_c0_seq1.p1  ORF type:complete len:195 (+),score=75.23 gnl/TRDRNA2_/TRDRNA2_188280_c0_seq1:75-659(+)